VPPGPATPLRVTVPVEVFPPTTDVGVTETPVRVAGLIVKGAVWLLEPKEALMLAVVTEETAVVFTVNVALFFPAAIVTGLVTVALPLSEATVTFMLFAGVPLRVIVPVEGDPPWTEVGERVRLLTDSAETVNVCVKLAPLYEAVITELPTPTEVTVNDAVFEPEATVTELGTVATEVDAELRLTVMPPAGAAADKVTVPVPFEPIVTVSGLIVNPERLGLTTLPI